MPHLIVPPATRQLKYTHSYPCQLWKETIILIIPDVASSFWGHFMTNNCNIKLTKMELVFSNGITTLLYIMSKSLSLYLRPVFITD
jgi:hypothetical protein